MEKMCLSCRQSKPVDLFYKTAKGYSYRCKECEKAVARERQRQRSRQLKVTVVTKVCSRCSAEKPAQAFHSNTFNPDGLGQYCKECRRAYDKTPESREKAAKNMRACRARYKTQPNTVSWWRHRMAGDSFLGLPAQKVKELFDARPFCAYCHADLRESITYANLDHRTPKSRGGSNDISNIAIACRDCNFLKHDRTDAEFRAFLREYVIRFKPENVVKMFPLTNCAAKETLA